MSGFSGEWTHIIDLSKLNLIPEFQFLDLVFKGLILGPLLVFAVFIPGFFYTKLISTHRIKEIFEDGYALEFWSTRFYPRQFIFLLICQTLISILTTLIFVLSYLPIDYFKLNVLLLPWYYANVLTIIIIHLICFLILLVYFYRDIFFYFSDNGLVIGRCHFDSIFPFNSISEVKFDAENHTMTFIYQYHRIYPEFIYRFKRIKKSTDSSKKKLNFDSKSSFDGFYDVLTTKYSKYNILMTNEPHQVSRYLRVFSGKLRKMKSQTELTSKLQPII